MKNILIAFIVLMTGFTPVEVDPCITDLVNELDVNPELKAAYDANRGVILKGWKKLYGSELAKKPDLCRYASEFTGTWTINKTSNSVTVLDRNNKQIAHITDGDPIEVVAPRGVKGDWNSLLNIDPPLKNSNYNLEGYIYQTDDLGRVKEIKTENLEVIPADHITDDYRLPGQQNSSVSLKDGITGEDDGGHLFAAVFRGPGEQLNYVPQHKSINRNATGPGDADWRNLEIEWEGKIRNDNVNVKIEVQIHYVEGSTSRRPEAFTVKTWYDGVRRNPDEYIVNHLVNNGN